MKCEYEEYFFESMRFPQKLWNLVNNCTSGAISWSPSGESITLEYNKFKAEFLCGETAFFKTNNLNSFIRQLNLYGFRKCHRLSDEGHEYKHPFFIKDRKDLLNFIVRKPGSLHIISSVSKQKNHKKKFNRKSNSEMQFDKNTLYEEDKYRKPRRKNIINVDEENRRHLLWNNFAFSPYAHFANNVNSWKPTDPLLHNISKIKKEKPEEADENKNPISNNLPPKNNYSNFVNPGNMYFLVVPGYGPHQNPYIFLNQTFNNGMIPIPRMPFAFQPGKKNPSKTQPEGSSNQWDNDDKVEIITP